MESKNDTNELIYKTETDPQTLKTSLWLPKGKGGDLGLTYTHYCIETGLRWWNRRTGAQLLS